MEDATMSTTPCAGQKRAAEDPSTTDNDNSNSNDNGNSTATCSAASGPEEHDQDHDEQSRQRSAKKPKLSKKEMLLAAKARLKEAQEKQKSLLLSLEEQKRKEQEEQQQQQDGGEGGVDDTATSNYNDDSYYYYEYMYHIPPVTGSRETLLVTDITSTGPEEKVRFLPEKQVGIESLMRVIQSRSRGISPTPITISTSGGTGKPKDRPGSRGVSPNNTPMATRNSSQPPSRTGVDTSNAAQHNGHPRPPQQDTVTTPAPGLPYGQQRTQFRSTNSYDDKRLPDRSLHDAVDGKHLFSNPSDRPRPPLPPDRSTRSSSRSNGNETASASRNGHSHHNIDSPNNSRPQHESPGQRPLFRSAIGNDNKRLPDRPLKPPTAKGGAKTTMQEGNKMHTAAPPLPPKAPPKPPLRPWKRALAHITGRTLDCNLDLPSNASYLIRTQDRSVLTRVRFLSAPDNATLSQQQKQQQQKSKQNTPFHLSALSTLPCNTSYAWKGVDILLFLQNQDQQRNNQKRTYLPPARRNLPLSHWAILELQHPFLPPHQQPLGCFTATLQSDKQQPADTKQQQQQQQDDKKEDIHFAGKLVWNMTLSDRTESNKNNNKNNNAKLVSSKWGEVVGATPTSGLRNGAMVLTVQGFYEYAATATTDNSGSHSFPTTLLGRKVILQKNKTIGIIVGSDGSRPPPPQQQQQQQQQSENSNNNRTDASTTIMGTCQVLLPNGVASGPSSVQALLGTRATLYD